MTITLDQPINVPDCTSMTLDQLSEWTGIPANTLIRWRRTQGMPATGTMRSTEVDRVKFLQWAAPRSCIRDRIIKPDCLQEVLVYHKAAMYDMSQR